MGDIRAVALGAVADGTTTGVVSVRMICAAAIAGTRARVVRLAATIFGGKRTRDTTPKRAGWRSGEPGADGLNKPVQVSALSVGSSDKNKSIHQVSQSNWTDSFG